MTVGLDTGIGVQHHVFAAMGTSIEILLEADARDPAERFATAEAEFGRLEALLSRFRDDSELTALNDAGRIVASAELREVVCLALAARTRTGGRFDPTVHDAMVRIGYDRSLELLPEDGAEIETVPRPCAGEVRVDDATGVVEVAAGVRLDLGGLAKGYAVDRVADMLSAGGSCLVNAGGDVAVRGTLGGDPWTVAVDVPEGALTLALARGALATSGIDVRCWRRGGVDLHHLIDPATGAPADTDLLRVTAFADTAADAEVEAKALLLAGRDAALAEADARCVPCVLVGRTGDVDLAGGLA
jgi:thiamine biosynthesis lipoprotein